MRSKRWPWFLEHMNRNVDPAKRNEQILLDLLKIESNKYCADCGQKGTRWASWNIGVFLCIRCGGLHRSLGTHISKVKSVTLDKWTDEQIESIKSKGNAKVNMIYNPLSDKHPFPSFSGDMENYIRDKYERKLFMVDSSTASIGPMSLKSSSEERPKNNFMDSEFSHESTSMGSSAFKSSSDTYNANFSKQLALMSEMGFTDTDFNYKTLKAANGNMQEALEIIVAANQKHRRKTIDKNIFDEIDEAKPSISSVQTPYAIEEESSTATFKSPPSINMDDWGFKTESNLTETKKEANLSEPEIVIKEEKPPKKHASNNNPWGNDFVDDSNTENETKKTEDPFDSYKAFRSTPSDSYFDNPW